MAESTDSESSGNGAEFYFPNLKTLRRSAALSMNKLSQLAGVSRDLISSLEKHQPHTMVKVMAVFNALKKHHPGIDPDKEITGRRRTS